MTIERTSSRYELLIRFAEDGSIRGAHQIHQTIVRDTDTDEVLSHQVGHAAPVDPANVVDVLGEHGAAITAQVAAAEAERDAAEAARDAVEKERDDLAAQVDALTAAKDEAIVERDALASERAALISDKATLAAAKVTLEAEVERLNAAIEAAASPGTITFRQLLKGLVGDQWITSAEASAWATRGSLPAPVEAVIAGMPEDEQDLARIDAYTVTEVSADSALLLGAARVAMPEMTDAQVVAVVSEAFGRWGQL